MRASVLGVAGRRVASIVFLGALPVALLIAFVATAAWPTSSANEMRVIDLRTVWVAAGRYMHGNDPYPLSTHELVFAGPHQSFVQTPLIAALFAPVSLVRYPLVAGIAPVLLAAAVIVALRLLGVRDWRCFGATFLSPAVLTSISIGTLTPLVFLGCAVAWRWRGATRVLAGSVGSVVAAKLLVWPLLLWLWATGRRGTAAAASAVAIGLLAVAFVPIGNDGVSRYFRVLKRDGEVVGPLSYGLASLGSAGVIFFILEVVSVALVVAAAILSAAKWQVHDRSVFAAAIASSILLSPIVHLHYFGLLSVAIAVLQPRFGWEWIAPAALWFTARQDTSGDQWRTVLALVTLGAVILIARRRTASALSRA